MPPAQELRGAARPERRAPQTVRRGEAPRRVRPGTRLAKRAPMALARLAPRGALAVQAFTRLGDLAPWRGALSELARASRRPSPFITPAYLDAFEAHDEFAREGSQPLLLLAFDGARLAGFLPLRKVKERLLGVTCTRLEHFTIHDMDRPSLAAAPEDEAPCAVAFVDHLATHERGWSFLELMEQQQGAALGAAAEALAGRGFYARRFPNNANATVSLASGFDAWFGGLGHQRANVVRRMRALLERGDVQLWASAGRGAAQALLDLYLDVEQRSWKRDAHAGISRSPRRVELFRAMLEAPQETAPLFHFLLLDGLPIAAMLGLEYGDTLFAMEWTYDDAFKELAPGNVLYALAMRDTADRGLRSVNLLGNFSYAKARWDAVITPTFAVQVYRRPSLHWLKARTGELLRRLQGEAPTQADADHNLSKPAGAPAPRADRDASRALAARVLAEVQAHGADPVVLGGAALAQSLSVLSPRRKSA